MSADEKRDEPVDIRAVVHGRVQGVGFRATTRHHAKNIGLVGTVRNMPDGSVEICARGPRKVIERLFNILKEEEFSGYIDEISIEETPISPSQDTFLIIH